MPDALEGQVRPAGSPGVRHVRLPGLTDGETRRAADPARRPRQPARDHRLLRPAGQPSAARSDSWRGLVRDYRPEPRETSTAGGPTRRAGGAFDLPDLDLSQRRSHILAPRWRASTPDRRLLLGWISVLAGAVDWPTLRGDQSLPRRGVRSRGGSGRAARPCARRPRGSGPAVVGPTSNTYDLHPIVRRPPAAARDGHRVRAIDQHQPNRGSISVSLVYRPRSVEYLRNTITLYRALI